MKESKKAFITEDFLLQTETAKILYHEYAKTMPVIDYHCHISPQEIYEDRKFENITQVWLGGDHYKWRQMRSNGVDEKYITGDATDREKFQKWAETLEMAIGNPLYHWSHLELKRYFGYDGCLNGNTAEEVWQICNSKLANGNMTARSIIKQSNVKLLCTTDDPVDSLEWHKRIREDSSFNVKVLPTWRPDKAMQLEKPDYLTYLHKLSEVSGVNIDSFKALIEALRIRMDFFESMGCKVSDHGMAYVVYKKIKAGKYSDYINKADMKPKYDAGYIDQTEMNSHYNMDDTERSNISSDLYDLYIEEIFNKRLNGEIPNEFDEAVFKTAFLVAMGKEYHRRNWVMQLHYGVKRDNSKRIFNKLGPDAGIDCINNYTPSSELADFLNELDKDDKLPKTILYSLNPADNATIGTVIGCFQDSSAIGKIQQGSAWWFNDHKMGMEEQMRSLASLGLLGNFIGMLTDSRSFLSYTRHEYFRRIMCNLIGQWVENGEYPADFEVLEKIVKGISYNNTRRYFDFDV